MLADRGYLALIANFYGAADGDVQALAPELRTNVDHYHARIRAAVNTLLRSRGCKDSADRQSWAAMINLFDEILG